MSRQLLIQCPDGQTKTYILQMERVTLGRSSATELCFSEDAGLSRQHLALEREGEEWVIQDLGSKNGTLVNNIPVKARLRLKPGDRISAGHLLITYGDQSDATRASSPVEFVEGDSEAPSTSTVVTNLERALSNQTMIQAASPSGSSHIKALIQAGRELAGHTPLSELFEVILNLATDAVGAPRGVVMVLENGELVPRAARGHGFKISSAVRDKVLHERKGVLVRDTMLDEALKNRASIVQQNVRTMVAVPLQTKDQTIGLIYVDWPMNVRPVGEEELDLLTVMANTAALRIEHARLLEVEQHERMISKDLEQAGEIQQKILPAGPPQVAGADVAGFNVPCRGVGGDYYDYFPFTDGAVGLTLGDVSGKGMPASLMMMGLQARVQALVEDVSDLGAFMTKLNKITCRNCPSNRFITFFFSVLDPRTGQLRFANAGHNPPVLARANGAVEWLPGGGPVLGILPTVSYQEYSVFLQPGDTLALYSDGVTESYNPQEEEFGEDRLAQTLVEHRFEPASQLLTSVRTALSGFISTAPAADDITLVIAKMVA